jgi:hypothetical protein
MPQQTAAAESITFKLLQQMIQTRFEGLTTTLDQTIENAVQVCVIAVARHSKAASLTIKIDFNPEDDGQIDIFADVDAKLPRPKPMPVRLFGTKRGELFTDNPDYVQPEGIFGGMKPRVVDEKKKDA